MKFWSRLVRILLATIVATQGAAFIPAMAASQSKRLAVKAIGIEELKSEYGGFSTGSGNPLPSCQFNYNSNDKCETPFDEEVKYVFQYSTEEAFQIAGTLAKCNTSPNCPAGNINLGSVAGKSYTFQGEISGPIKVFNVAFGGAYTWYGEGSVSFSNPREIPWGTYMALFTTTKVNVVRAYRTANFYEMDFGWRFVGRYDYDWTTHKQPVRGMNSVILKKSYDSVNWLDFRI